MDKNNNSKSGQTLSETDDVSLKELILNIQRWMSFLLSRWLIIVLAGIVCGALGLTYAWFKKPVYTADSTFVLEEEQSGTSGMLGQYSGLASMVGIDIGGASGGIFHGENILELYKSHTMVERALLSRADSNAKSQMLIDKYIAFSKLREQWDKKPELRGLNFALAPGHTFTRMQDSVLNGIIDDVAKNYLIVDKPDKKLSIIRVEVKAPDESFAYLFNNAIVNKVNDFYVQTKTKKATQNLAILQHQTDSVRSVLNGAIYQSAAVADATPNLNPTRQVLRVSAQKSQVNAEANKAILSELIKNLELAKLSLRKETPLIQTVDTPVYPLKKEKLGKLKALIIGGFIGGILAIGILLMQRGYKNIMTS